MSNLLDEIILAAEQADAVRQATGFWPVLGHHAVDALTSAQFSDGEPAERFEGSLKELYGEAHLRPALVEFWWEAIHTRTILYDDEQQDRVSEYTNALNKCVDFVAPSSISDVQIRWELDVAATTGNIPRVLRLLDELKHRPCRDDLSQSAVRLLFLLVGCSEIDVPPSGAWVPEIELPGATNFYRGYSALAWITAVQLKHARTPPKPNSPASLRKELVVSHIRSIREWVDIARDSGAEFRQEVRAIEAWVTYCLGLADRRSAELERAGALYEGLPDYTWSNGRIDQPWRWAAAAVSYQDGESFAKALSCAHRWAELAPDDPLAQRKVAELCWKQGNLEEALKAFELALADEAPSDRAWEQTAILQLGLEKLTADSNAAAIERAADRTPLKDQGKRLAVWLLPWFGKLSEKAAERFWFGLYAVSSAHLLDNTGQAAWDNAGDNFGESLAFELKHRVIEPFASDEAPGKIDQRDKHWVRLISGRATLGEIIECVLSSLRPTSDPARALRKRLDAKHKPLVQELIRSENDLKRLYRLRADAQHGTLSEAGVREVFATVCRVFAAIHATSPTNGSA